MEVRVHTIHILLLSWAAGSLDALSYRGLDQVFTTNITGNTVLFAIAISLGDGKTMLLTGMTLAGFCVGAFCGGLLVEWHRRQSIWTPRRVIILATDTALLVAFSVVWLTTGLQLNPPIDWLLIMLATVAMGLQSILLLALALSGISPAYITGSVANLMAGVTHAIHVVVHAKFKPDADTRAAMLQQTRGMARLLTLWFVFGSASLVGNILFIHVRPLSLWSPLVANTLIILDVLTRLWWRASHR